MAQIEARARDGFCGDDELTGSQSGGDVCATSADDGPMHGDQFPIRAIARRE